MTSYTTGTTLFNLDLNDLIEEAFERCGMELRTGYDFRTARRSLNLLTVEWANRGINMWTIDQGTINLVQGQNTYALPTDTIDLLEHQIRTQANQAANQTDITISRISVSTYATIPNKLAQGRPIQVWIQRLSGNANTNAYTLNGTITSTATTITLLSTVNLPAAGFIKIDNEIIGYGYISGNTINNCSRGQANTTAAAHTTGASVYVEYLPAITVWPTPDGSQSYQFIYWRLRRIQDAGNGVNIQDIPFRFVNCLVAGLAYYLSLKLQGVDPMRSAALKADYEQQFQLASEEDREKAPVRFVPRRMYIGSGAP